MYLQNASSFHPFERYPFFCEKRVTWQGMEEGKCQKGKRKKGDGRKCWYAHEVKYAQSNPSLLTISIEFVVSRACGRVRITQST